MTSLNSAVRENPLAASLIGLGVLWLFMGGNRVSVAGGNGRRSVIGAVSDGAERVSDTVSSAASTVSSGISSAADTMRSGVSSVAGTMSDAVSSVSEGVKNTASSMMPSQDRYGANQFGGYGSRESHSDYDEDFRPNRGGPSYGEQISSQVGNFRDSLTDLFDRHPLALGAAGLALGAGVAASLPLTDAEAQVLGKASEAAYRRASEAGEQAMEMAGAVAEEAKRQLDQAGQPKPPGQP